MTTIVKLTLILVLSVIVFDVASCQLLGGGQNPAGANAGFNPLFALAATSGSDRFRNFFFLQQLFSLLQGGGGGFGGGAPGGGGLGGISPFCC